MHLQNATKDEAASHKLIQLMHRFTDAMLVTRVPGSDGMRARPMRVAECDEQGNLWFVTSLESGKVPDLTLYPDVTVTMQGGGRFLSIYGRAEIVVSNDRLRALWREPWKLYFPKGLKTPDLALIRVESLSGEYWDASGLMRKLRFLVEAGKAYWNEETIAEGALEHERVLMPAF